MHTQGKLSTIGLGSTPLATTHAHAGQTDAFSARIFWSWNHPCTRGADIIVSVYSFCQREPPMHTRGRRGLGCSCVDVAGTTHAHAGQTSREALAAFMYRNHPCTRGADACFPVSDDDVREPPMHTRGRRDAGGREHHHPGTTHAHAGQTLC